MDVLIGCEFSGVVRDEFRKRGHNAWSCDILNAQGNHYQMDVFKAIKSRRWDLIILHPPCTYLAVSGNRYYSNSELRSNAVNWTIDVWETALRYTDKAGMENPIGVLSRWRKPTQIIQPWMFGHGETKATCLWLHGLPMLQPTNPVKGRLPRVWLESPGVKNGLTRQQRRSITYQGIAEAMAEQWGNLK